MQQTDLHAGLYNLNNFVKLIPPYPPVGWLVRFYLARFPQARFFRSSRPTTFSTLSNAASRSSKVTGGLVDII